MKSLYEKLGGTYVWNGDYQIPQLATDDRPSHPLGKYGKMRLQYLQAEHPGLYSRLILSGNLYQHLEEVDDTCRRRLDEMIPRIAEAEGVNESLKSRNQMSWVGCMNEIHHRAEETVLSELIFC